MEIITTGDKFGKRAGPEQNLRMLLGGKPNFVLAFCVQGRAGQGSGHTINAARSRGIQSQATKPMILIKDLITTQNGLRNVRQIPDMVDFVNAGGRFTADARIAFSVLTRGRQGSPPIHIARLEDDRLFLHDGHHRSVAKLLAGCNQLYTNEYVIKDYTYKDYSMPRVNDGWLTPFDLNSEVRLPDFGLFKNIVRCMIPVCFEDEIVRYIYNNRSMYCESRQVKNVGELVERLPSDRLIWGLDDEGFVHLYG